MHSLIESSDFASLAHSGIALQVEPESNFIGAGSHLRKALYKYGFTLVDFKILAIMAILAILQVP